MYLSEADQRAKLGSTLPESQPVADPGLDKIPSFDGSALKGLIMRDIKKLTSFAEQTAKKGQRDELV